MPFGSVGFHSETRTTNPHETTPDNACSPKKGARFARASASMAPYNAEVRATAILILLLGAPGFLLPGGIELRACFCGGLAGGCCHALVSQEESDCQNHCCGLKDSKSAPRKLTVERDHRCSGCVRLSVPHGKPVWLVVSDQPAPPAVSGLLPEFWLPEADETSTHSFTLDAWHAPPIHRQLPLLI
jgi:hypothetical protein